MIDFVPENERAALIQKGLNFSDQAVQLKAVSMIKYAAENQRAKLFALAKANKNLKERLILSPLYDSITIPDDPSKFARIPFEKTHSETTLLLGESFNGKVIIREIEPGSFAAWKFVYDSPQAIKAWRDAGFDYIPVESIY